MYNNVKTISVGTFNLMNFLLPGHAVYGGTLCYSKDEYRRKSEWINFMLTQMNADIIGFQELFDRDAMLDVIKRNPLYKKAKLYMAEETDDQPSVALLSRFPVENIEVFHYFPEDAIIDFNPRGRDHVELPFTTFTRSVLKADIRIRDYGVITVFVVHLKSKREIFYTGEFTDNPVDLARAQSRSLMLRASEAVALRSLVTKALELPERPVILCGDVNDTGNAVTSRIISGEVPQHRLDDEVKRKKWNLLLYHVKDIQARRSYQDYYYTHIHNGMYESLDHIMVSQELVTEYPRNTGRVSLVSVYNDHLVDQTFTQKGVDKCKSDHGVVVCSLELDLDRAKQFMPENNILTPLDDPADPQGTLNALDEDRLIAKKEEEKRFKRTPKTDSPSGKDDPAQEDSEPAAQSEPAGFNMDASLDRWKRNHPNAGKNSGRPSRRDSRPPLRQSPISNRDNNVLQRRSTPSEFTPDLDTAPDPSPVPTKMKSDDGLQPRSPLNPVATSNEKRPQNEDQPRPERKLFTPKPRKNNVVTQVEAVDMDRDDRQDPQPQKDEISNDNGLVKRRVHHRDRAPLSGAWQNNFDDIE